MTRKKLLSLVACVLLLSAVGCGGGAGSDTDSVKLNVTTEVDSSQASDIANRIKSGNTLEADDLQFAIDYIDAYLNYAEGLGTPGELSAREKEALMRHFPQVEVFIGYIVDRDPANLSPDDQQLAAKELTWRLERDGLL